MKDVMLSFGKGLDGYLTKDQIRNSSPLVFADAPTNPNLSKKYLFVNTERGEFWGENNFEMLGVTILFILLLFSNSL